MEEPSLQPETQTNVFIMKKRKCDGENCNKHFLVKYPADEKRLCISCKNKTKAIENNLADKQPEPDIIMNRGKGAGGANTNYYGKQFEDKTNNQKRLLENGYTYLSFAKNPKKIYDYYLFKPFEDKTIVFVLQNGLKQYMKHKYNIELFRCPDEAYIIEYNTGKKVIKILEKKEQNVEGSVETKLWSGPSLKREYELVLGNEFEIHYAFCVSNFLKKKMTSNENKYVILNTILKEANIIVLFGDDNNYFDTFDNWFNNSL